MAEVSVDVVQLRQVIADLRAARTSGSGAALDLQGKLSQAGVWSSSLSSWTFGPGIGWIDSTIIYLQRRLDYAELLLTVTLGDSTVVTFNDDILARLDEANIAADIQAAFAAVSIGDAQALQAILQKYQVESTDPVLTYSDPFFGLALAQAISPRRLAALLLTLDQDADVDLGWYDGFLTDLAESLSAGARAMTASELADFTAQWGGIANEFPQGVAQVAPVPPGYTPPPSPIMMPTSAAYVQLLSLVVARGNWPNSFLTGMVTSIQGQEGASGAAYWLSQEYQARDPGVLDPETGLPAVVKDPMRGIWYAAVQNPQWLISTYGGPPFHQVEFIISGRNDPTHMFDTEIVDVPAGLDDLFHRGFDQASFSALMTALAAADVSRMMTGQDPVMIGYSQVISKALLLEEYLNPPLPQWLHTMLDIVSFIPVADILADSFNAFLYWVEGDEANAALYAGAVFIPGFADWLAKIPGRAMTWIKSLLKFGNDINPAFRPAKWMDDLLATGEKFTPESVMAVTRTPEGKVVWLETGNVGAGMQHILDRHTKDFIGQGIQPTEIPNYLMTAVSTGKVVATQGKKVPPRVVYEFIWKGETRRVALDIGSNGFIVSANPKHRP